MNSNEILLEQFYESFAARDFNAMKACYTSDVQFTDPVFSLTGKKVGAMWHMLCESGQDLKVTFNNISANDANGKAHWEALYTFSSTGHKVLNIINASFDFTDGKISRHTDVFNFWKWSGQALGLTGKLLGWSPFLHKQVQQTAAGRLEKFIQRHPEYASN